MELVLQIELRRSSSASRTAYVTTRGPLGGAEPGVRVAVSVTNRTASESLFCVVLSEAMKT